MILGFSGSQGEASSTFTVGRSDMCWRTQYLLISYLPKSRNGHAETGVQDL